MSSSDDPREGKRRRGREMGGVARGREMGGVARGNDGGRERAHDRRPHVGQAGGKGAGKGGETSGGRVGSENRGGARAGGRSQGTGEDGGERPFRPRRSRVPPKPTLPEERPRLAREVYADLRASARPGEVDDVASAYAAAGDALAEGDVARGIELLEWAKSAAARSAAVREALGVARYHAGDFAAAHSELLAYRRLSGRQDQNHLLADCARAAGRPDKVAEYVDAMDPAAVPADRIAEGIIVLASDRADRGDLEGAMRTLERADLAPAEVRPHQVRLWYLAADLAARTGEQDTARDYLEAISAVDADYLDVAERLQALGG